MRSKDMWFAAVTGFLLTAGCEIDSARTARTGSPQPPEPEMYLSEPDLRLLPHRWHTPVALTADSRQAWIAGRDSGRILALNPANSAVREVAALARSPQALLLAPDDRTLFAGVGAADGELVALDADSGKVRWRVTVGHTPAALAVDGNLVYVASQFSHDIAVVDRAARRVVRRIPAVREPVALAMAGSTLVIVNQLPLAPMTSERVAAEVTLVDLPTGEVTPVALPSGTTACKAVAISPDRRHAYVTAILARWPLPTTQIERGWIHTNALLILDLQERKLAGWFLLDDPEQGSGNPWGCAVSHDGGTLAIALSGIGELMLIDRADLHRLLGSATPDDYELLGRLNSIRRRVSLNDCLGPQALVAWGDGFLAANAWTDDLSVIPAAASSPPRRIVLGPGAKPDAIRRGEIAFHDATLSFQGWSSCSSCHPGDARTDGLNWDLLNDGIGSHRNTKSLVGAHATPPTTWTGVRKDAEVSVRAGMNYILFMELDESVARDLDAYLASLRFLPSPHLRAGRLSEAALRGQVLFEQRNCVDCHTGVHLTNGRSYDLGTGDGREPNLQVDVPSLREVWRTAPYLHDGRALTVADAIRNLLKDPGFRERTGLRDEEVADLAEYVQTL